jgi:uncharacterized protein YjcR
MKKLTVRQRSKKRGLAQLLIAEGKMTDREIAKFLKVSVSALNKWKAEARFKSTVRLIETQLAVIRARSYGVPIISYQTQGGETPSKL